MQAVKTKDERKPLTQAQEQVYEKIRSTPGGFLKPHHRTTAGMSWKLMDKNLNPIQVFTGSVINQLLEKDYLKKEDHIIVLKEA